MKNGSIISMVLLMTFTRLLFSAFSLYKNGTKTKEEKGYWELVILDGKADLINTSCLGAADTDGDRKKEMFVGGTGGLLSGEIWWIKPIDPVNRQWEEYRIGKIGGDWAHGSAIAPFLPGEKLALVGSSKELNPEFAITSFQ